MARSVTSPSRTSREAPRGASRVTAVVPTLGRSPLLMRGLEALRADAGAALEVVVVDQGPKATRLAAGLADRVVRLERNEGFAGGTNRGMEAPVASRRELVATVNDDLLVEPGWLTALIDELDAHPRAAAVQGLVLAGANFESPGPEGGESTSGESTSAESTSGESTSAESTSERGEVRIDGCGLAWNRRWQAVQRRHGRLVSEAPGGGEIFGVSATAALYRRAALEEVRLPDGSIFDVRLASYYEDVDLACRLRAAGWSARFVPSARAFHAGSTTGRALGLARLRWIYGNRHGVLARVLGGAFWRRLPALVAGDLRDLAAALARGEGRTAAGVVAGLGRGLALLPRMARRGAPALPLEAFAPEIAEAGIPDREGP